MTQLSSSANPSSASQTVTFTAIVTPAAGTAAGTPTGTVTFTIDGVAQTPCRCRWSGNDQATFTTATLALGTNTISAGYSGDPAFAPSTSPALAQLVNPATPPRQSLPWALRLPQPADEAGDHLQRGARPARRRTWPSISS